MIPEFSSLFDITALWGRRLSSHMRGMAYSAMSRNIGNNLRIDRDVTIRNLSKLKVCDDVWLKEGVLLDARSDQEFGIVIDHGVTIRAYSYLDSYDGNGFIHIGAEAGIGQYVYIGGNGGVRIGRFVMISNHTTIVSATHLFDPTIETPYFRQGESRVGVVIEDNAWIASNCVIMDGVAIGAGAVIGAGSVVTRSIPPKVLAVGCPARIIRSLSEPGTRRPTPDVTP